MHYWDEMNTKYGFGDGDAIPREAELARSVYVQALNAVAERLDSKVRAVCYNRGGCHNPILIVMVDVAFFNTLTPAQVEGDGLPDWPDAKEPHDDAWKEAVAECMEMGLDDYIVCEPKLAPEFSAALEDIRAGRCLADAPDEE